MKCYMPGIPRGHLHAVPVPDCAGIKPVHSDGVRVRHRDANHPHGLETEAPTDTWMGWSRGHWEGDTLVVDVTGQREETWFDRAGNYHSDMLHVVERFTPVQPYH
jgi:hypothetical protein